MPKQTLGGIPLGLGMVMKINFLNFHVQVYAIYYSCSSAPVPKSSSIYNVHVQQCI